MRLLICLVPTLEKYQVAGNTTSERSPRSFRQAPQPRAASRMGQGSWESRSCLGPPVIAPKRTRQQRVGFLDLALQVLRRGNPPDATRDAGP
jgi:hypothetical protein